MRLAIIGGSKFSNYNIFRNCVNEYLIKNKCIPEYVLSGSSKEMDSLVERWCCENKTLMKRFQNEWGRYGKAANLIKNKNIINESTHILAFLSFSDEYIQQMIMLAKEKELSIDKYYID